MFPVIFSAGPVTLYSYGVALFIAFFAALFVVWKRGREVHFDEEELFDALLMIVLMMLLGARWGYVLIHFEDFGFNIIRWLNVFGQPGLWFLGGLLAGGVGVWWQSRKRRWDVFALSDVMVMGLVIAQTIMSFGAFLNGSGYGLATESFYGMQFPGLFDRRIPVQLFETIAYGLLFGFLWWVEGTYRTYTWYKGGKSEANSGFITAAYLIGSGILGIIFTLMRPVNMVVFGLRLELLAYFGIVIFGVWMMVARSGLGPGKSLQSRITRFWSKKQNKVSEGNEKYDIGDDIFN